MNLEFEKELLALAGENMAMLSAVHSVMLALIATHQDKQRLQDAFQALTRSPEIQESLLFQRHHLKWQVYEDQMRPKTDG